MGKGIVPQNAVEFFSSREFYIMIERQICGPHKLG